MTFSNPEFRRNLLLELSTQRLIIMPLVLLPLFLLGWTWGEAVGAASVAQTAGWALLVFWGTRLAVDSLSAEVQAKTWDGQRLSGIGPVTMTVGKLFGGTIYAWYGGVMCLAVSALAGGLDGDRLAALRLLITGFFAQAVAFWFGMIQLRLRPGSMRFQVTFAQIVGILVSAQAAPLLGFVDFTVDWYGIGFDAYGFVLFSTILFTLWAWVACWRLMRADLRYQSYPFVWLAFLAFLVIYFGGVTETIFGNFENAGTNMMRGAIAFHVLVFVTWFAALVEPKNIVRLRQVGYRWRQRDWRRALTEVPPFVVGLPVVLSVGIATALTRPDHLPLGAQLLSLFLFLLRDILLVYFVVLGPNARRGHGAALIFLLVLYLLAPALIADTGAARLMPFFIPAGGVDPVVGLIGPAVQVIGFGILFASRFRDRP
ncbi:hypothetical protein [Zavarzinia compransoris]|uniref:hypothetical protein n=1 Tax=Zavarzinia compransoris TaxID=1264899 RepID=UPI0010E7A3F0|nr:hypothetical protein [Zavarzinia compransoris]TDP48233.1 hypothetical protein DES42_102536 [Zavarzinia compransoris]